MRDLGEWVVVLCEQGVGGTFNATHPGFTWSELVDACTAVSGSDAAITWVPDAFLLEHEVGQWMELPLWLANPAGSHRSERQRALAAGLTFRPLEETARGALEDAETTDAAGLTPTREAELLAAWHGRG